MIEVRDLSYEYPTTRALDHVSFTVEEGAIAALVGPNGAGKTTLLRNMAALERPYSGTAIIDGVDVREHPREVHKKLGFLQDFFGLYDDLTVTQCLTYAAMANGLRGKAVRDAVEKTLDRIDLREHKNKLSKHLSRGMRQRLAIGQAIAHEPKVLLLDEPASGLDPDARRDLSALLRELQGQGITLIVSSHILAELEDYSTEMIIMDGGRVKSQRSVEEGAGATVYTIDLASPNDGLAAWLNNRDGLTVHQADDARAMVSMEGDASVRSQLLKDLLGAGFEVAGISETKRSLADAYFEEVSQDRGEKGGRS
jgi:ABC-2 type transport system ATP-binding protein